MTKRPSSVHTATSVACTAPAQASAAAAGNQRCRIIVLLPPDAAVEHNIMTLVHNWTTALEPDVVRRSGRRSKDMTTTKAALLGCCLSAALWLSGCGGGSGGPAGDFAGVGNTGASAVAFGPVAGF